jgi:hypothetical protein
VVAAEDVGSSRRRHGRALVPVVVLLSALAVGAWAYFLGPFDGEWRLERKVANAHRKWEAAGHDASRLPVTPASRATAIERLRIAADGRRLTATITVGQGTKTAKIRAVESPHGVALVAMTTSDGGSYPSIGVPKDVTVLLDDPIAERLVYDATTGQRLRPQPG